MLEAVFLLPPVTARIAIIATANAPQIMMTAGFVIFFMLLPSLIMAPPSIAYAHRIHAARRFVNRLDGDHRFPVAGVGCAFLGTNNKDGDERGKDAKRRGNQVAVVETVNGSGGDHA